MEMQEKSKGTKGTDDWFKSLERIMEDAVGAGRFQVKFTSTIDVNEELTLPPLKSAALIRITQETFNNITQHSKAGSVRVNVMQNRSGVILYIFDDGDGFDLQQVTKRSGLANIYADATRFNGMVDIITAPGYGCSVTVLIPYD